MDSIDYILQLKARKGDHLAYQAATEFQRQIERLTAENSRLREALTELGDDVRIALEWVGDSDSTLQEPTT